MINVYDLTNATVVALFGMFALWAAASRRHWFVRTAVVAGAILITLLIPAYELVILLSVETLLVVAGIAFWRRRRKTKNPPAAADKVDGPRLRLSMQTLMLAVVIIAVITAVAARVPALDKSQVYSYVVDRFMAAEIALVCVWIIFGRARWWLRACAFPLLVFVLASELVSLHWAGNIVRYWYLTAGQSMQNASLAEYLKLARRDFGPSTLSWSKPIALGMVVVCTWMYCVHRAGWFDPFDDRSRTLPEAPRSRRALIAANGVAVFLFCIVSFFPSHC